MATEESRVGSLPAAGGGGAGQGDVLQLDVASIGCPVFGRRSLGVPSSENAAVEAGVLPAIGVRWFRKGGGMPPLTLAPVVWAVFVVCRARRDRGAARRRFME